MIHLYIFSSWVRWLWFEWKSASLRHLWTSYSWQHPISHWCCAWLQVSMGFNQWQRTCHNCSPRLQRRPFGFIIHGRWHHQGSRDRSWRLWQFLFDDYWWYQRQWFFLWRQRRRWAGHASNSELHGVASVLDILDRKSHWGRFRMGSWYGWIYAMVWHVANQHCCTRCINWILPWWRLASYTHSRSNYLSFFHLAVYCSTMFYHVRLKSALGLVCSTNKKIEIST